MQIKLNKVAQPFVEKIIFSYIEIEKIQLNKKVLNLNYSYNIIELGDSLGFINK